MTATPRPASIVSTLDTPRGPLVVAHEADHPEPYSVRLAGEELARRASLDRALYDMALALEKATAPHSQLVVRKRTRNGPVEVQRDGEVFTVSGGGKPDTRHPTWDYACDELWRRMLDPRA